MAIQEQDDTPPDSIINLQAPQKDNTSTDDVTGASITIGEDSVVIDFNPSASSKKPKSDKFNANLADELEDGVLASVAMEIIEGIESDLKSRSAWESAYNRGIELMGLEMKEASSEVSAQGSVSKVTHPLLLEATIRYQSNSMAELLPSSGPVKVRDDDSETDLTRVKLADDFEKDFNHYLTTVAKEYYPDTDQMLFNQGWAGLAFKKVFECPIRKRPCSDLVLAPDLIVSNDVVDLENASRLTHRTYMNNGMLRRFIKNKVYRKCDLGTPNEEPSQTAEKASMVMGIDIRDKLPADHRHTVYETYICFDLPGYEEDVPLPYKITIDKDSKQVLAIYRNWEKGDEDNKPDIPFVKFGMIPALGFYDLGFIHLLGNTTRTLTAILRMQLDAGQFSIFPAFLYMKSAGKQISNIIRLSPGQGQPIETGGLPLQQAVMHLPYPGPSSVLESIAEKVAGDGMRLGGASEIQVGEGRADVPVGTTMALIEQASKNMAAVHKRNHVSQQREFEKLRNLFNKNPKALTKFNKKPARNWETAEEFADLQLVPASDPNIPSHTHRLMQASALVMLAKESPQTFNIRAVAVLALTTIGIKDPNSLLAPLNAAPPPPDPMVALKMKDLDLKQQQIQLSAKQQADHDMARLQEVQQDGKEKSADRESRERIAHLNLLAASEKHKDTIAQQNHEHATNMMGDQFKHVTGLMSDHVLNGQQNDQSQQEHTGGMILDHAAMLLDKHKHDTGLAVDHAKIAADHDKTKMTLESQEKQAAMKPKPAAPKKT